MNNNIMNLGKKPKSLMCYICGKDFGTNSLEIHMKKCSATNNKGIPENYLALFQRINSGDKLVEEDYENFNNKANDTFKEETLVACHCGRRFFPDRLVIHQRGCKPTVTTNTLNVKSNNNALRKSFEDSSTSKLEQLMNKQLSLENKNKPNTNISSSSQKNSLTKSVNIASPMKPKGPVFLTCYVCSKEFSKHSLEIHLEKCMDKHFNEEINRGVPKSSIKTPNPPEELLIILEKVENKIEPSYEEIQNYNQIASSMYRELIMKQCLKCLRKFDGDRLDAHLKSCNPSQMSCNQSKTGFATRPRMFMCPLCGKEFGSMSLDIHVKTCIAKYNREQELLPPKNRKSAETIIEKYKAMESQIKASDGYNVDMLNQGAYEAFNNDALVPCELCQRTFYPDRLIVHQRSCKGPRK